MPERKSCECGCVNTFTSRAAEDDLRRYRQKGLEKTTRALIGAVRAEGVEGATLLDIGGGIGVVSFELLGAGVAQAVLVDASDAYIEVARREAERRGFADRTSTHLGAFQDVAAGLEAADIVALDRVVCCDPDVHGLVGGAAAHARRVVGLVYPRDIWWNRVAAGVIAAVGWLTRDPTRWHLHRTAEVDGILRRAGFTGRPVMRDLIWQVVVYTKAGAGTA